MMWALVIDGVVHETTDIDPEGRFAPDLDWIACPGDVAQGWRFADGAFAAPAGPGLEDLRAAKVAAISARAAALLAAGAPYGGHHIALDAASRADLGAMATTALAAQAGSVPWPESYALGWISLANIRIPLPTPADGLALAAEAGDCYACIVQTARNLKDAALAAPDADALAAIDVEATLPAA